jgi:chitinase
MIQPTLIALSLFATRALARNPFNLAATNPNASSVDMVAATWFAGWHAFPGVTPQFAVSNVSWDKYTSVIYSFAII